MKRELFLGIILCAAISTKAGGFLTNTNQSALFLRNPAIDAYLGSIENAYSNPAGTVFLKPGFHVAVNILNAKQQRIIDSEFGPFMSGQQNNGESIQHYVGKSYAPAIPSVDFGYNTEKWAVSLHAGITGGGGKCEFDRGLGSFEASASLLPMLGSEIGIESYDIDTYMRGRQYYYGVQAGAAYKIKPNLSIYGGLRLVYATTNYYGYIRNISIGTANGTVVASDFFSSLHDQAIGGAAQYQAAADQCRGAAAQYTAIGDAATAAAYTAQATQYQASADEYTAKAAEMTQLANATQDVTLNCDQSGVGFTPIIGIDWKINNQWNLAAKYEFKTRMRLKNKASNSASCDNLATLSMFYDGKIIPEDIPALLTLGVQYTPIKQLRLAAGFHFYDDKNATKHNDTQKLLSRGTTEYLASIEYDFSKNITASAGWQNTSYGLTDAYMSDISFITSSNSIGFGVRVNLTERCHLDISYFHTFYNTYHRSSNDYNNVSNVARMVLGDERVNEMMHEMPTDASGDVLPFFGSDTFTRKNRVFGAGISFDF